MSSVRFEAQRRTVVGFLKTSRCKGSFTPPRLAVVIITALVKWR